MLLWLFLLLDSQTIDMLPIRHLVMHDKYSNTS